MEFPAYFIDDIANGRCFPFIGAGFSLNSELDLPDEMPNWNELMTKLASEAGIPTDLGY